MNQDHLRYVKHLERLLKEHKVIVYNRSSDKTNDIAKKGAEPTFSIEEFLNKFSTRRIIWLMLPAGQVTDDMIKKLLPMLNEEDIIIDGANDFYENAEKHNKWCEEKINCGKMKG